MTDATARDAIAAKAASGGYIQTYGGRRISIEPGAFDVDQIHFDDVAMALPHINRYAGHTPYPYSVAQHCIVLARTFQREREALQNAALYIEGDQCFRAAQLRMLERWAFIHDWPEYAINDIPAPFKRLMPDVAALDERITNALAARYGLPTPMPLELMDKDRRLCRNEMEAFGPPGVDPWWLALEPVPFTDRSDFRLRTVDDVRAEFIDYARSLFLV